MEIAIVIVVALLIAGAIYFKKSFQSTEKDDTRQEVKVVAVSAEKLSPKETQKMPSKNKLMSMTKADIIQVGEDLGIMDLKSSMKKEDLINDLRKKFAAAKKAAK